ncbi:MAG: sulfatase-like hydrolase/transferase [Flavisolibacter sp.]|nr:sulfatase-like hydrolase/transferase [Flavisolibacter sp.]
MRTLLFIFLLFITASCSAQQPVENIIIVTTDGLRWQEVFKGMDSAIANDSRFNQGDSAYLFKKYWGHDEIERRKKLFPFLWSTVATQGQLYGNRLLGNKVDNANPYWFSYPGYSEMMTGYADTAINSNDFPSNPNINVLEFLNRQSKFKGRVAAFGTWAAFDRILNEGRSGFPVVSAFDKSGGNHPTAQQQLINAMLADSYKPWQEDECQDVFTHFAAIEELKISKPKVLYIAYGETDEWAHSGQYRSYLNAAHQVDAWIKQIWEYVQSQPQYKNKTALFITTDHGRGDAIKKEWTSHGNSIKDAYEIWFAVVAPNIPAKGEMKSQMQLYQKQFTQTISKLLGYVFKANQPVAKEIEAVFK